MGARGWIGEPTLQRLSQLDAGPQPLRWLAGASDEQLLECYRTADLLLAPSRAEGFGLPIVEAQALGVPVLARDIPVFREVGGDQASYFTGDASLPDAISAALSSRTRGAAVEAGPDLGGRRR